MTEKSRRRPRETFLIGGVAIAAALFGFGSGSMERGAPDLRLMFGAPARLSDGFAPAELNAIGSWALWCGVAFTLAIAGYCLFEFGRGGGAAESDRARALVLDARHGVGNKLALIAAAVRAQARGAPDRAVRAALETAQLRILAVAETLRVTNAGDGDRLIKARPLLQRLAAQLEIFAGDRGIGVETEFDDLDLSERDATSFMLVVNELVVNAIMYGFSSDHAGRVRIALRQHGRAGERRHILTIEDDGAAIDRQAPGEGLGHSIVTTMVRQLGATIEYATNGGEGARVVVARAVRRGGAGVS